MLLLARPIPLHLFPRRHHRHSRFLTRTCCRYILQRLLQYPLIQEDQRIESLVLRRSRHSVLHRQNASKTLPHFSLHPQKVYPAPSSDENEKNAQPSRNKRVQYGWNNANAASNHAFLSINFFQNSELTGWFPENRV